MFPKSEPSDYGARMAGRAHRAPTRGPYDPKVIADRIEMRRRAMGVKGETLSDAMGLGYRSAYSKKRNGIGSQFSVPEISAIAAVLDGPPGWPFIPEHMAEKLLAGPNGRGEHDPYAMAADAPLPSAASRSPRPGKHSRVGGK